MVLFLEAEQFVTFHSPSMVSPLLLPFLSAQAGLCLGMTYSGFGICLATFLVWKRKIFLVRVSPEGSHTVSPEVHPTCVLFQG